VTLSSSRDSCNLPTLPLHLSYQLPPPPSHYNTSYPSIPATEPPFMADMDVAKTLITIKQSPPKASPPAPEKKQSKKR